MYFLLKLNVDVLVNSVRDRILGNKVGLTSVPFTWAKMRASSSNINNWLELHITG